MRTYGIFGILECPWMQRWKSMKFVSIRFAMMFDGWEMASQIPVTQWWLSDLCLYANNNRVFLFRAAKDEERVNRQADCAHELDVCARNDGLRKLKKKRRFFTNIAHDLNQLNAPIKPMLLPDDLTSKLNLINDDTAASNRLFTNVLSTKHSLLQLNICEKFIERSTNEIVRVSERNNCNRLEYLLSNHSACSFKTISTTKTPTSLHVHSIYALLNVCPFVKKDPVWMGTAYITFFCHYISLRIITFAIFLFITFFFSP